MFKNTLMKLSLGKAKAGTKMGEVPVGALISHPQKGIISIAHNLVESTNDPTAHAEMIVIHEACEILKTKFLSNCDLYVTLEPCPMCAHAMILSRIRRLFFGAKDSKLGCVESNIKIFAQPNINHKPEVYGGIMEEEASLLLSEFFKKLR
jgi:tRNA(adenine34) deaminase